MAITAQVVIPDWSIENDVYIGFWLNRAMGTFHGATLTVTRQTGGLVIAFVALFIAAAARSVWKIIRFALHMGFTSPFGQGGVHHQRQAILRNIPLPNDAVIQSLQLGYVWRRRAQHSWVRAFTVVLAATIVSLGSSALGVYAMPTCGNLS